MAQLIDFDRVLAGAAQLTDVLNREIAKFQEGLLAMNQAFAQAVQPLRAAFDPEGVWWERRRQLRAERAAQVERLLGHANDGHLPEWVQQVHAAQVESFGTGNGRGENWIERGLPSVSECPRSVVFQWYRGRPPGYTAGGPSYPPL